MACITKRRGRYVIDCYDQHGKRYRKTLKVGITKNEARKELREIEDRIAHKSFMNDKKTPVLSKVAEDWLEYKKPQNQDHHLEHVSGGFLNCISMTF